MARPSKSTATIRAEGKSHRTKAELATREQHENNFKTGKALVERPEVKSNKVAHKEFLNFRAKLKKIDKDDDLYSAPANRYCQMYWDYCEKSELANKLTKKIDEFLEELENSEFTSAKAKATAITAFVQAAKDLVGQIKALDPIIMNKHKAMLDIEKEMGMTVSASLRIIPKTPTEDKNNELMKALMDDEE
ncbi:MAG: hypothetical protein IJ035_09450 [Oscillospiraceae bacterium]|nr:hypothetical protein [Oscillospiraceae bacterium]